MDILAAGSTGIADDLRQIASRCCISLHLKGEGGRMAGGVSVHPAAPALRIISDRLPRAAASICTYKGGGNAGGEVREGKLHS